MRPDRRWYQPSWRGVLRALAVLLILVVIPAAWVHAEYRAAAEQTRFVAGTGGQWAQERLGALLGRFDTVTLRLRPGATPAENAALTARLLRLEPQLSPATTLFILGPQLRITAASQPLDGEVLGADAERWMREILDRRPDRIELGAFGNPPLLGLPGHVAMARRLDDGAGSVGLALSFIEAGELRALIHPPWLRRVGAVRLVDDASGRVIAAHAASDAAPPPSGLVAAMRRGVEALPGAEPVLVRVSVGQGLSWSVALDPWEALARDEAGLRQRGLVALSFAVGLAVLTLLASLIPAGGAAGRSDEGTGVAARPRGEHTAAAMHRPDQPPAAPISRSPPVVDESAGPGPEEQVTPTDVDPARFVEGILDSDYVDPAVFDALAREFGEDHAAGMLREFVAAVELRFPRLAKLASAREWGAFVPACEELRAVATSFGAVRFAGSLQRLAEVADDTAADGDLDGIAKEWRQTRRALLNLVAPDKDRVAHRDDAG